MSAPFRPATPAQVKFINLLTVEIKLDRVQLEAIIKDMFKRTIKFPEGLSQEEAHKLITKLKYWKDLQRVERKTMPVQ